MGCRSRSGVYPTYKVCVFGILLLLYSLSVNDSHASENWHTQCAPTLAVKAALQNVQSQRKQQRKPIAYIIVTIKLYTAMSAALSYHYSSGPNNCCISTTPDVCTRTACFIMRPCAAAMHIWDRRQRNGGHSSWIVSCSPAPSPQKLGSMFILHLLAYIPTVFDILLRV